MRVLIGLMVVISVAYCQFEGIPAERQEQILASTVLYDLEPYLIDADVVVPTHTHKVQEIENRKSVHKKLVEHIKRLSALAKSNLNEKKAPFANREGEARHKRFVVDDDATLNLYSQMAKFLDNYDVELIQ